MSSEITREVVRFQKTGEGWKELSDRLCLYAYRYPRVASDWDEDRCSEFFMSFYPRIRRLVDRYRPEYSFETYLCSCLKWHMKTFLDRVSSDEHYDAWWTDPERIDLDGCGAVMEMPELPAGTGTGAPAGHTAASGVTAGPDIEYAGTSEDSEKVTTRGHHVSGHGGPFRKDQIGRIADPATRRRLMYVLMLRAPDLSAGQVESLAPMVDEDPVKLADYVREATESVNWKVENRERLRRRRNECWYRMKDAARRRQAEEVCDGNRYREWRRKEQTWKNRYESASRHLRKIKVNPSHKDISRILNVPEGTISSGLHLLRKKLENPALDRPGMNV